MGNIRPEGLSHPWLPHSEEDIRSMLHTAGIKSLDDLFSDIPEKLRIHEQALHVGIPAEGLSEPETLLFMQSLAETNRSFDAVFAGGGCYDHFVPSAVRHLSSQSGFLTAYTPYQAEISQGMLQAIFEYQTLVCQLTGMDVSNASLYDGHTAAAEAVGMALNTSRKSVRILVSKTMHPHTLAIISTYLHGLDAQTVMIPEHDGVTDRNVLSEELEKGAAGVLVQTPNAFGYLEDLSGLAGQIHRQNALFIISSNPVSLSLCTSQGDWGADIAIGDMQPCGLDMNFGGPGAGYISSTETLLRKLPGRIVGETLDARGERAFVLTLQAREQHIRRQRSSSGICTNQALAALRSAVYLACLGKQGFRDTGRRNYDNSHYVCAGLTAIPGVALSSERPFFNEFTLRLPVDANRAVECVADAGILAGIPLNSLDPDADPRLLVTAVTEKQTKEEMDRFIALMKEAVS